MQKLTSFQLMSVCAGVTTVTTTDNSGSPWKCDCTCYNQEQVRFIDESDDTWLWLVLSKTSNLLWGALSSFWK